MSVEWFAGLFEGEGYVGFTGNQIRMTISMTDEDVLRHVHQQFGGLLNGPYTRGHKPVWMWVATNQTALDLIIAVYPHLFSRRREQVDTAIAEWEKYQSLVAERKTMCRSGRHKMSGRNIVTWGGQRRCRACWEDNHQKKEWG